MARAMGRSLFNTLFGALKGGSTLGALTVSDRPVRSAGPEDVAILLAYAERVIIVPGYGLAVAQAQHTLKQLVDVLLERGAKVDYAIHPVAGRMPGHMNVLLAEAQVPYEQLKEMDEINPEFKQADVVLVVGANDVVNPAAETSPGAPIYGMPILHANQARQVVFMKRSMRPGFAGHRERAALRADDHAAVRRRQGHHGQAAGRDQGRSASEPVGEGRPADSRVNLRQVGAPGEGAEGAAEHRESEHSRGGLALDGSNQLDGFAEADLLRSGQVRRALVRRGRLPQGDGDDLLGHPPRGRRAGRPSAAAR